MKKIFKKFGLSLAALICVVCAGVGVELSFAAAPKAKADTTVVKIADGDFYISGAGVRLVNDENGAGVRFHTRLTDAEYAKLTGAYKTGTLIIPAIRYDGELTLDDLKKESKYCPVDIETTNIWYEAEEEGFMQSTAYLYGIPETAYGARYVVRSYVTYEDGTTAYSYTDSGRWQSMSDVATTVYNSDVSETTKAQVEPYIVENVTVTYNLTDGSQQSETVAYGEKLASVPDIKYDGENHVLEGWKDQYGNSLALASYEATLPVTLTPVFGSKIWIMDKPIAVWGNILAENTDLNGETVPTGFTTVKRSDSGTGWTSGELSVNFYDSTIDLSAYGDVWFALKTVNCYFNFVGGLEQLKTDSWIYFHLTQTGDKVWTIEITVNGVVYGTLTNQSGSTIKDLFYDNGSNSTDGGAIYLRRDSDGTTASLYLTEVLGLVYDPKIPEEAVKISSAALSDNTWSHVDVSTESHNETTPMGFSTVTRFEENANSTWTTETSVLEPINFDLTDLSQYNEVWFALKVVGGRISEFTNWTAVSEAWAYFHLTQTATNVWTIEATQENGDAWITVTDQDGSADGNTQPINSISVIFNGHQSTDGFRFGIYKTDSSATVTLYSTEVLAVKPHECSSQVYEALGDGTHQGYCSCGEKVGDPVACSGGEISCTEYSICAYCGSTYGDAPTHGESVWNNEHNYVCERCGEIFAEGVTLPADAYGVSAALSDNPWSHVDVSTEAHDETAPAGFSTVTRFEENANSTWTTSVLEPINFNLTDLSQYDEVWFALKVVGGRIQELTNWTAYADAWVYFHLTQTADSVWTIETTTEEGKAWKTVTDQDGSADGNTQPINSISVILNGNKDGFRFGIYKTDTSATATLYSTEVIVGKLPYDPKISEEAEAISSAALSDNDWSHVDVSTEAHDETAPAGFSTVTRFEENANSTWTTSVLEPINFDLTDLSQYDEVWFALKVVGGRISEFTNWTAVSEAWAYFHLTQTAANVWTIEATKENGDAWITVTDQDGSADGNTQPINSISVIFNGHQSTDGFRFGIYKTDSSATATLYSTEVFAVEYHECSSQVYEALGDGTHQGYCSCGLAVGDPVACSGGKASCTEQATCSFCNERYGNAAGHSYAWVENDYQCSVCGDISGSVNTVLDKQTIALNENETSASVAVAAKDVAIDLSGVSSDLTIESVTSVSLDGVEYESTYANNQLTISVLPQEVFGEYTATVDLVVAGKAFTITIPVLFVTDMITTSEGLLGVRFLLRGADKTTGLTDGADEIGGTGGDGTMNGDGYYMLGADVALNGKGMCVFGTSKVPFIGTFDGNGYSLKGYEQLNWFGDNNSSYDYQDASSEMYGAYLEASLFGVANGTIKNVAFTGFKMSIYTNLIHSGSALVENVYLEGTLQGYSAVYTSPFFTRAEAGAGSGTLRNVVFNFTNADWTTYSTTSFPAATGKGYKVENVAVYGFNNTVVPGKNIYVDATYVNTTDGSQDGIYVTYTDGTTNGATFWTTVLDPDLWKIVNGIPVLKNVTTAEGTSPDADAPQQSEGELTDDIVTDGATQYYITWDNGETGSYDAVQFIIDIMKKSTGATLSVGVADTDNMWTKQIIVGTYDAYGNVFEAGTGYENDLATDGRANYGVYLVDATFFVLAENEEGFGFAAQKLCRELFGYNVVGVGDEVYNTVTTLARPDYDNGTFLGTSQITFTNRSAGFSSDSADSFEMNFNSWTPYVQYSGMHNTLDYFGYDWSASGAIEITTGSGYSDKNVLSTNGRDGDGIEGEQLCYLAHGDSNSFKNMVTHVADEIVALVKTNSSINTVNFMIEDDSDYCGCSYCSQFSNPSITQLIFLNEVARVLQTYEAELGKVVCVEFFAYSSFQYAPVLNSSDATALASLTTTLGLGENETVKFSYSDSNVLGATYTEAKSTTELTVLKAESNLRLWWTSHKANHSFALSHAANDHMYLALMAWIASIGAKNIDVFMYQTVYRDYFLPLNTWEYQIVWYQELNKLSVNNYMFSLGNVYNEAESQTAFSAFKTYIDSRAMTDSSVTFEQLKDEFFAENGYYGKAGPTMRKFFEELVTVMEGKKQTGDTVDSYVDVSTLQYTSEYVADFKQSFFNGAYNYYMPYVVFPNRSSTTITGETDLYVHSSYGTQLLTLEAWYTYCQTALTLVEDAKYIKRIKMESIFPEYAILLLYTKYDISENYQSGSSWKGTVTCTKPTTNITISTYQEFYNKVVELGITRQSEFYTFDSENVIAVYSDLIGTDYGLYASFFKNWGVTF